MWQADHPPPLGSGKLIQNQKPNGDTKMRTPSSNNTAFVHENDRGGYSIYPPNELKSIGNYATAETAAGVAVRNGWRVEPRGRDKTPPRDHFEPPEGHWAGKLIIWSLAVGWILLVTWFIMG